MKKRLLSALLALALVFVLLPTTALAGETTYSGSEITISGKYWNFGNKDTSGKYAPVYFQSNGTAFQESKPTGSNYLEIKKTGEKEITITVYGTVNLTENESSTNSCISVNSNGVNERNLIITGAAKGSTLNLTCKNNSHPLYSYEGSITINGGVTVNATSQYSNNNNNASVYGIQVSNRHDLTISGTNTKVNVVNKTYDSTVKVNGNITVSDGAQLKAENKSGKVTGYTSKKAYAIECGGKLSISGDKTQVTADTSNGKKAISGTVNNGDKLTFKAANSKGSQIFLQRPMDEALGYAYVEITQAPTDPYVFIAGEPAIMGQETPIPGGSGTYLYVDAGYDGNILTLKDATINKTDSIKAVQAIRFGQNGYYTIKLEGENKISGFSSGIVAPNDSGVNNVTVVLSGSGSLDISAKQYAIDMQVGKLKFENTGKIMLTTSYVFTYPLNALRVKTGSITIDNTKYDIVGARQEKNYPTEVISDSSVFDPAYLNGYTVGETTTLFKTITITPAAAKDSTISYNRKTLKQGGIITGENGGTATVDSKNNTITLDNFKGNYPLEFNAEFTPNSITLIGDSTLSAVETKYQNLTISGSGSLTVGSIKVHKEKSTSTTGNTIPNLTINGATVTVGNAEITDRAIDIDGDLTVTNGSLKATSTSDSVPTVQVGGNASFTGSSVTITNNSTTQGKQYEDSNAASSALHVNGAVTISGGTVTAEAKAGGNAIRAVGNITVSNDATVTAKNNSQYFNAITAGSATGGEVNTLYNLIVSGENTRITATNAHDNKLAYGGAINAYIENANEGHYLKANTDSKAIAPNDSTTVKSNDLTITRGDEVTRTNSPVVIDGHTLLNDTYYTINGSTVAEGTDSNYNAFYDSATKTLKLNNASINGAGTNKAIEANVGGNTLTIELVGNNIVKTSGFANNVIDITGNLYFTGSGTAEISGKGTPIYATYKIDVSADVTITNTEKAGSFTFSPYGENYKGANTFAIGAGYTAYATTDKTTWAVYDNTTASENESYTTLRITTQPPETGGGSTHEHVFSTSWESNADYHWHKCTVQGCTEVSDKEAHVYTNTWWKNSNGNHGRTCDKCRHEGEIHEFIKYYDFADETYHVERCGYLNCTYVGRQETHSYDSFGTCKCGYNPNGLPAPPSLQGVAPTSENGTDGKILNSNIGMEYAQNLNGPWTKWNEHSNITGLSAGTYYVRYTKTDERFPDNQVATVEVPAYTPGGDPTPDVPAAPTGLAGVAPTSANSKDGKITGTTAAMEYATSLEGDWTACANGSTDVPAGKYYVRMKKTDNTPAGEAVEVTVPAYSGTGEIVPPTPDNPGTIVIIRPAEEEKPAQQPNPSTGANDLVGLAVAAAVAAALGSAALLRKHD